MDLFEFYSIIHSKFMLQIHAFYKLVLEKKKFESLLELITVKKIRGYLNFYGKLIVSNKEMNTFTFSEAPPMKFSLEGDLKHHIS